jgi:hypothetical protein
MYQQEPGIARQHGYTPDPAMSDYVARALSACEDD